MPRYTNPRKTWKYTREFKVKAVRLSLKPNIQSKDVAEALDIHPYMLSRWRKEYREGKLTGYSKHKVFTGTMKKQTPSEKELSENARLKAEIERLKEENDLLKKWQRYLAEQHQHDLDSSKDTEN